MNDTAVIRQTYAYASAYHFEESEPILLNTMVSMGDTMIVDGSERYIWVTKSYCDNMGIDMQTVIGQKISDVLDHTEIPSILRTGQTITSAIYYRNGQNFWVRRCPLKRDGKVIGVFALAIMAEDISSQSIKRQLGYLTRSLNYYKTKYEAGTRPRFSMDAIVAQSRIMRELKESVMRIAATRSTVLLTGESGTGKEVFADAIHYYSPRADRPFVKINCAAIPDHLLESELFGYTEGSFTGALKGGKIGDFEAADGGTLFLDEINSLPLNFQAKLLRVIQEREVKRIGESQGHHVDVRLIFATNQDLKKLVAEGKFREDLYFRINVINLELPPLRERREDIPLLIDAFIKKFNEEFNADITGISADALLFLQSQDYPGNIRELENMVERAFNFTSGGELLPEHFSMNFLSAKSASAASTSPQTLRQVRAQAERTAIIQALKATGGNKKEAAAVLDIDRSILYDKLKLYAITADEYCQ